MPRSVVSRALLLFCLLAVCATGTLVAEIQWVAGPPPPMEGFQPQRLFPWARFDPSIPTQEQVLGFAPAARPMRHGELIRYLRALMESSPRATMRPYSRTHEGRPMVFFAVSDEETIAGLDDFKTAHAARVDPRQRAADGDAAALDGAKAVAWMAYGIHGDELSSVDAAAALAYWLVAGEDERAVALRRDLLILIDPCENPDGRERFLAQTTSFGHKVANPDKEDLSHTTVWPWGRGNHYLFDLNRDWFSMVQPESRRSGQIAAWSPQLVVDSHEMGSDSSYLFSPPRHPYNPYLPQHSMEWSDRFAADQAQALDGRGYPYYTGEWNEEFFPGYGSSYASYFGAVGILYEMSGTEGTLVRKRSGSLRTFPEAIEHQATSSVANLETLAANRAEILGDFVADRREIVARAGAGKVGAWLLPEGRHPERTRRLIRSLNAQGIEVMGNDGAPRVGGLIDARTGEKVEGSTLPERVWMVRLDQPLGALARQILDPHVPMESGFLQEEREYLERGKGTRLYETTSWSLALAYDVEAYWTKELPGDGWSPMMPYPRRGAMHPVEQPFAYLIDGVGDRSAVALAWMLQHGVRVRVAEKPFRVEGKNWRQGTLLMLVDGNVEGLAERLGQVAEFAGVEVHAVATGKAEQGPDLGGGNFRDLIEPRVGIWTGSPISPTSYGALWHVMDEEVALRFSGLNVSRFQRIDLDRYNVLIFPPAFGSGSYRALIGESGISRLKQWIEGGGTAIGIGGGARFLADTESGLTTTRLRSQALDRYPPVVLGPGAAEAAAAGPFVATGIRAAEGGPAGESAANENNRKPKKGSPSAPPASRSPYDVAPILGAGARPFAEGHEQGTPASTEPVGLAEWLAPMLAEGKMRADKADLEKADDRLRRFSPRGAFLRIELDSNVWLTWGLPAEMPALTRTNDALVAGPPVQVAARFADVHDLHLGGLLWPEAAGRLAHTAYVTREGVGRGQVILFLNEPEFRGWTLGTRRLLLNSVLFGPGLGTRWSTPW